MRKAKKMNLRSFFNFSFGFLFSFGRNLKKNYYFRIKKLFEGRKSFKSFDYKTRIILDI